MKDEIKEILQLIGSCCYYGSISEDKCEKYCNCITNLQEENEILRKNAEHNDKVVDKARWNEMIYKSRNEKAIEYIYEHREEALFEDNNGKLVYALSDNFDEGDLLNILGGKNE